jgi:hypothetical protein
LSKTLSSARFGKPEEKEIMKEKEKYESSGSLRSESNCHEGKWMDFQKG